MLASLYKFKFPNAANNLNADLLTKKKIEVAVVNFGEDCVVLKLYKKSWASDSENPLTSTSRLFFSVWISDSTLKEQKIFYNIHALKLRQLKGYKIESRKFAEVFRISFKPFQSQWENVSVDFGPLTLMEGWLKFEEENLEKELLKLSNQFLEIEHLIDETLLKFKKE